MTDRWSTFIRKDSSQRGVESLISAINQETGSQTANQADVMVACSQVLGQCIALGGESLSLELRQAIIDMIDEYALETAAGTET